MGKKDYSFAHTLGVAEGARRLAPELQHLTQKYGLKLECPGDGQFRLKGSGVNVTIDVSASNAKVTIELGMLMEVMRGQIEQALSRKVQKVLA